MLTPVTITKPTGMTQSSLSFAGVRVKATFEKRRQGVKSEMLRRLILRWVTLSVIPTRARSRPARHLQGRR